MHKFTLCRRFVATIVAGGAIVACLACTSSRKQKKANSSSEDDTSLSQQAPKRAGDAADLGRAMDQLENAIEKPSSPFHVSFKKSESNGAVYQCEADVSSAGIVGQQKDFNPETKVGDDVFPAKTVTRQLNGSPIGSQDWSIVRGGMVMTYMNGHIRDGQPGVKYMADEQVGGTDARRYDFDLAGLDTTEKEAMGVGSNLGRALGATMGARKMKDYNVKGSAWIAKQNGEMLKFQFDNIMQFADGENDTTHYEGLVTSK